MSIILKIEIVVLLDDESQHVSIDPDGRIWGHEARPQSVNAIGQWQSDGWMHQGKMIAAYPVWKLERNINPKTADNFQYDLSMVDSKERED